MPIRKKTELMRPPGFADDYIEAHKAEQLPKHALTKEELEHEPRVKRFVLGNGPGRVTRRPHVALIAADAYTALMNEAARLRDLSIDHKLTPAESASLIKTIDGLCKLSREMRELDAQERAEDLSDEELEAELIALAKKADT